MHALLAKTSLRHDHFTFRSARSGKKLLRTVRAAAYKLTVCGRFEPGVMISHYGAGEIKSAHRPRQPEQS